MKRTGTFWAHTAHSETVTKCCWDTEKRHKYKAEHSPKGWRDHGLGPISKQKLFSLPPSQRLVSTEGSSFVCQPHSFILHLTPFCVKHKLTHFFKFLHEQVALLQLPFLFLSSLCTPVSTHMSRHTRTYASVQPSHEPPSSSLFSARAISLTDVIVSPAGVLSVTEVGASECV